MSFIQILLASLYGELDRHAQAAHQYEQAIVVSPGAELPKRELLVIYEKRLLDHHVAVRTAECMPDSLSNSESFLSATEDSTA